MFPTELDAHFKETEHATATFRIQDFVSSVVNSFAIAAIVALLN